MVHHHDDGLVVFSSLPQHLLYPGQRLRAESASGCRFLVLHVIPVTAGIQGQQPQPRLRLCHIADRIGIALQGILVAVISVNLRELLGSDIGDALLGIAHIPVRKAVFYVMVARYHVHFLAGGLQLGQVAGHYIMR